MVPRLSSRILARDQPPSPASSMTQVAAPTIAKGRLVGKRSPLYNGARKIEERTVKAAVNFLNEARHKGRW
jgi:hypothetical protein